MTEAKAAVRASGPVPIGNRTPTADRPAPKQPLLWHNTDRVVRSDGRNSGYEYGHYSGTDWRPGNGFGD